MANAVDETERGRDAYERRAWLDAYTSLSRADEASPLGAEDLELLANSASMVGRMDDYLALLERAHRRYLDAGNALRAARCAGWIGMNLAIRGEIGPARGWFGRAQRLVEREGRDSVEQGWLLLPAALQHEAAGDYEAAYAAAVDAARTGERFGDADLSTIALHVQGLARIKQARVAEGLALLDEAMVAVTAGEVSPVVTGIVYCGVIAGCEEAFEPRRAQEWTEALTHWIEEQPQMVAFTGRCLAHRAGIKQRHGAWRDALEETRLARQRSEQAMNRAATGQALYQQGELHRLQGDFAAAEAAYRDAIRRALGETTEPLHRAGLLPAYAEIMLAVGDVEDAREACRELTEIAGASERAMLGTIAAHVKGAVELAEGNAQDALVSLRRAWHVWQELEAPYEAAQARVLIGLACRALGDADYAAMELEAARDVFELLGAAPEVARVDAHTAPHEPADTHGLSPRELEVLRLVAAGKTNRDIASMLVISEHTVARHVQNIFAKVGVSSRAAAGAFAFEHDLV
jgi:DNA-binding CsgD family transcriptional regulator/tetratricopeptide (TPR) repeat protein